MKITTFKKKRAKTLSLALIVALVLGGIPSLTNVENSGKDELKLMPNVVVAHAESEIRLEAGDFDVSENIVTGFTADGETKFEDAKANDGCPSIILDMSALTATSVAANAFKEKFNGIGKSVSVKFPSSLTTIGASAFEGNKDLNTIELNEGLKIIEKYAFKECNLTGDITFPESLKKIYAEAFRSNKLTGVTIPKGVVRLERFIFANNLIERVELGTLENLTQATRWSRDNGVIGGMIPHGMFYNNKIQSIQLPDRPGFWAIGESAFANNDLRELVVPKHIQNIYFYGFQNNPNLTKVIFEKKENPAGYTEGIVQIDRGSFENCNISEVDFPDTINEIGGLAFSNNKITELKLPKNGWNIIGYNSFMTNPIERIEGLNPGRTFEEEAFSETNLKNINFDAFNPLFNIMPNGTFKNGKLKSLEIPSNILYFWGEADQGAHNPYVGDSPFAGNSGWYDDNKKVALYRKVKAADGTLRNGNYVTDNAVADTSTYVFNPVLVEFEIKDSKGQISSDIPDTLDIVRTRTTNGTQESVKLNVRKIDAENFKVGDKITISTTLPGESLEKETSLLTKVNDTTYEIVLDKDSLEEVTYGQDYDIGYQKAKISLRHKAVEFQKNQKIKFQLVNLNDEEIEHIVGVTDSINLKLAENKDLTLNAKKTYDISEFQSADKIKLGNLGKDKNYRFKLLGANDKGEISLAIDRLRDEKTVDVSSKTIVYTKTVKVRYYEAERKFGVSYLGSTNMEVPIKISVRNADAAEDEENIIRPPEERWGYKNGEVLEIINDPGKKKNVYFYNEKEQRRSLKTTLNYEIPEILPEPTTKQVLIGHILPEEPIMLKPDLKLVLTYDKDRNLVKEEYTQTLKLKDEVPENKTLVDVKFEFVDIDGNPMEIPENVKKNGIKLSLGYYNSNFNMVDLSLDAVQNVDIETMQGKFKLGDMLMLSRKFQTPYILSLKEIPETEGSKIYDDSITLLKENCEFVREENDPLTGNKTTYYEKTLKIVCSPYFVRLNFAFLDENYKRVDDELGSEFKDLILRKRPNKPDTIIDLKSYKIYPNIGLYEIPGKETLLGDEIFLNKTSTGKGKLEFLEQNSADKYEKIDGLKLIVDNLTVDYYDDDTESIPYYSKDLYIRYIANSNGGTSTPNKPPVTPPVTPEPPKEPEKPKEPEQPKEPETTPEPPAPTPPEPTPNPTPTPIPSPDARPIPNPVPDNPRPAYPRTSIPDANDPAAPDEITIINDDGVPLGNYEKKINPDGTAEYVIMDEEVPLAPALPATGGTGVALYLVLGTAISLLGLTLMLRKKAEK